MAHKFNEMFQYKILESTRTEHNFSNLPKVVREVIQKRMGEYFESEEDVVEKPDGTIDSKKIDYRMRDASDTKEDKELSYSRYNIGTIGMVQIDKGTEFEKVDSNSFIEHYYETTEDETIPLHYEVYYSMCALPEKEEVVMNDAIIHTYTYLEYLESIVEN